MDTLRILRVAALATVVLAACSSDGEALCQEPCESGDDCAAGYICMGVGSIDVRQCVPVECDACAGQACEITQPTGGQCSFIACQ